MIKVFFTDYWKQIKEAEALLNTFEARISYNKWYCARYHTQKTVDKVQFLFGSILKF